MHAEPGMTLDTLHARPSNDERYRGEEEDAVLVSRLGMPIYALCIAAAFVAITVYRLSRRAVRRPTIARPAFWLRWGSALVLERAPALRPHP